MTDLIDKLLVKCSDSAYINTAAFSVLGFNRTHRISSDSTGTVCYMSYNDMEKIAVLTFRGTEPDDIRDIKTDLSIFKTENRHGIKVHKGFYKAYKSIEDRVDNMIRALPTDYKLYITGHSLGGALAVLATMDWCHLRHIDRLVTFGQPRLCGYGIKEELRGVEYRRYVYKADVVPRVPFINYWHTGTLYQIMPNGKVVNSLSKWKETLLMLKRWVLKYHDHMIERYVGKIRKLTRSFL